MESKQAKFTIGQVVKHRVFPFRGVIFDVDPVFSNTEEWYQAIPAEVRPVQGPAILPSAGRERRELLRRLRLGAEPAAGRRGRPGRAPADRPAVQRAGGRPLQAAADLRQLSAGRASFPDPEAYGVVTSAPRQGQHEFLHRTLPREPRLRAASSVVRGRLPAHRATGCDAAASGRAARPARAGQGAGRVGRGDGLGRAADERHPSSWSRWCPRVPSSSWPTRA